MMPTAKSPRSLWRWRRWRPAVKGRPCPCACLAGKKKSEQQLPKMDPLLSYPRSTRIVLLPNSMEVTEGGTPLMGLPPKPMEVIDGGTPFTWACIGKELLRKSATNNIDIDIDNDMTKRACTPASMRSLPA